MFPQLNRLTIYTKDVDAMGEFYGLHFGYTRHEIEGDRITELRPPGPGAILQLHPAGAQKMGQVLVKLTFDVADVLAFCETAAQNGLVFSRPHKGDGYIFANAKDPSGNNISVSSRAFATP